MPRAAQQIRGIQIYRRLHLPPAYAGSLPIVLAFSLSKENRGN